MRVLYEKKEIDAHLVVKHFGLAALGRRDEVLIQNIEDVVADLGKFCLNLLSVLLDEANLRRVALGFFLLLDRGDDSPRSTAGTNDVLVGDRQKIALLNCKITVLRRNNLHVLNHL